MPNHVIVSTLGWSKQPLAAAIDAIGALEFGQVDLALHEGWAHLDPSALVQAGPAGVRRHADQIRQQIERLQMKRVSAFNVGLRAADSAEEQRCLEAVCDLAHALDVTVITIGSARRGTAVEDEIHRLTALVPIAAERGVLLTVETHVNQLTERPDVAVRLCESVDGLGLTLDASHYYAGPNQGADFSAVLPFVKHVHLRDAGTDGDHMQVPAGSGKVDFRWIVTSLHRLDYEGKFAIEYIDTLPLMAGEAESSDIPANVLRMRDLFVAAERNAGIKRS